MHAKNDNSFSFEAIVIIIIIHIIDIIRSINITYFSPPINSRFRQRDER